MTDRITTRITAARRAVEWLDLSAPDPATSPALEVAGHRRARWEAANELEDLIAIRTAVPVRAARRGATWMDIALLVVALLVLGYSLGNIHGFAVRHGVGDPIAWFIAPAIDIALGAALLSDSVLSRMNINVGVWGTVLRVYAGAATLGLNSWESWAHLNPAGIVLHTVPPVLLILLSEAAPAYRVALAESVRKAAEALIEQPTEEPIEQPTEAPTEQPTSVVRSAPDLDTDRPARTPRPRRKTGAVPPSVRETRVRRSMDEATADARRATSDWSTDRLTADAIAAEVHVGMERARRIRDLLVTERAEQSETRAA